MRFAPGWFGKVRAETLIILLRCNKKDLRSRGFSL